MAAKLFYLLNSLASDANHWTLQDGGSAPSTSTTATGWTVATTAPGNYSAFAAAAERAAATFATTPLPDISGPNNTLGDCFRSDLLTGRFKAGNWTITVPLIALTAGGAADLRIRTRMWKSTDPTGAGALEILTQVGLEQESLPQVGTTVTNLATGAAQNSVITWAVPYFGLQGEYLFLQVALEIVGAGAGATDDALFVRGAAAKIDTTDWSPADQSKYHLILDGQGLLLAQGAQGWQRSKAREFAAKQAEGNTTNSDRLREAIIEQTSWEGGSGLVDGRNRGAITRYRQGYGVDTTSQLGAARAGPGLTASLSSARNAQRVFGFYNGQLYVGASTGQVARQTATDTWTDPVGTITSNRPVTAIAEAGNTVDGVTARLWIANGTTAGIASWNGTTFTNSDADANVGPDALSVVSMLATWSIPEPNAGLTFIVGGTRASGNYAVCALANDAAWSTNWVESTTEINASEVGYPTITAYLVASDGQFYWCASDIAARRCQVIKSTWGLDSAGSTNNEQFFGLQSPVDYLPDDYLTGIVEMNGVMYGVGVAGRIYVIETDHLTLVSQDISPSGSEVHGVAAWNNALWVPCRDGTSLLVRRYGPSDPTNPESDLGLSEPIYGGAIDASATAARQAIVFGGDLYVATEAAGASKVYRMREGVYSTSAVTLESSLYNASLPGVDKLFKRITVEHAVLLSGESIQVQYRLDDTGAWLTAGTSSTVGPVAVTFVLATAIGQAIAVRLTLTAASSASSPTVNTLIISAFPSPEASYEWSLRLDLSGISGSLPPTKLGGGANAEPWTGLEVSASLWSTIQRGWPVKLLDIDGVTREVLTQDWRENLSGSHASLGGYRLEGTISLVES